MGDEINVRSFTRIHVDPDTLKKGKPAIKIVPKNSDKFEPFNEGVYIKCKCGETVGEVYQEPGKPRAHVLVYETTSIEVKKTESK